MKYRLKHYGKQKIYNASFSQTSIRVISRTLDFVAVKHNLTLFSFQRNNKEMFLAETFSSIPVIIRFIP